MVINGHRFCIIIPPMFVKETATKSSRGCFVGFQRQYKNKNIKGWLVYSLALEHTRFIGSVVEILLQDSDSHVFTSTIISRKVDRIPVLTAITYNSFNQVYSNITASDSIRRAHSSLTLFTALTLFTELLLFDQNRKHLS